MSFRIRSRVSPELPCRGSSTSSPKTSLIRIAALHLFLIWGCESHSIELDPTFIPQELPCVGADCANNVPCEFGSGNCSTCGCCPCFEGEARCDLEDKSKYWVCTNGCFEERGCGASLACFEFTQTTYCDYPQIPCDVTPPGPEWGACENDCWPCQPAGNQWCDWGWRNGYPTVVSCNANQCYAAQECGLGSQCISDFTQTVMQCEDYLDCETLGCTGVPICNLPGNNCGECGCCDYQQDFCSPFFNDTPMMFSWKPEEQCYEVYPCANENVCHTLTFDTTGCNPVVEPSGE